jgi:hypothetical protein
MAMMRSRRNVVTMKRTVLLVPLLLIASGLAAQISQPAGSTRGELLYRTHCIACHSTQVHWRDQKIATDWSSLFAQVRRWQANVGLNWPDSTVEEVTRYLNSTIYRFPDQAPKQTG